MRSSERQAGQEPRPLQWRFAAICAVVAWQMAACSPQASAPGVDGAADVALAETVVLDAEVDGTDSLPDIIADVPDVADTSATADSADAPDIPYWIAHDIDIAGLGVVNSKGSNNCDPYIIVQPNDPPTPPTCTSACPAPFPCTCGTCPWIQTPPMNVPRMGAKAIWTGDEVLVFGGADQTGIGGVPPPTIFTAERWKPSGGKGFEMIDLPFTVTAVAGFAPGMDAVWTGTEVIGFLRDHQFRFDPKTSTVTEMPLAPVHGGAGPAPRMFWANDTLLVWGIDRATYPSMPAGRIVSWTVKDGWQDIAPPPQFAATPGPPACATILDGGLFVFEPSDELAVASTLDPNKPIMVRYDLTTKGWDALPQTMLPNVHCSYDGLGNVLFAAFPEGIAFIPPIGGGTDAVKHPPVGEIWWKATGKWTAMAPPPLVGPFHAVDALWTGTQFVIFEVSYTDPVTSSVLLPDAGGADVPTWPIRYDPYADAFHYTTSVGYPKHVQRNTAALWSGNEIFALGGHGGIDFPTLYNDGVRLSFPQP